MTDGFVADAFIFDVDGVLLDVTESFHEVIRLAVETGWEKFCGGACDARGYGPGHAWVLKRHGSFNDDYDIVWTLLSMAKASGEKKLSLALPSPERLAEELRDLRAPLGEWLSARYGELPPRGPVRALCAELYGDAGRGLNKREKPLLSRRWDELGLPVAIYSGRNAFEWTLAKKNLGWEDFPDTLVIHSDLGIKKPSPAGLEILCGRMGVSSPVFFGDTASDMKAQASFGRGRFAAIGHLLPEARYRFDTTEEAVAAFAPERAKRAAAKAEARPRT